MTIGHELVHVLQARRLGVPFLAHQQPLPAPSGPGVVVTRPFPAVRQEAIEGAVRIFVRNQLWITVEWDPAAGDPPEIEYYPEPTGPEPVPQVLEPGDVQIYGMRIRASHPVHVALDRSIEAGSRAAQPILWTYDFQVAGPVWVDGTEYPGPLRLRELYPPDPGLLREMGRVYLPPDLDRIDPYGPIPEQAPALPSRHDEERRRRRAQLVEGHPAFSSREAMERYVRRHPDEAFVGIVTEDGRFVARQLTEENLQQIAGAIRADVVGLEEVELSGRGPEPLSVLGVYLEGAMVERLADLANLYYAEALFAEMGQEGVSTQEAEIFRVGEFSYGRRDLTHTEALERWQQLDGFPASAVAHLETEPGRPFVALWVAGPSGLHEVDERYFRGRDAFYASAAVLDRPQALFEQMRDAHGQDLRHFLRIELDRALDQSDPRFRQTLQAHAVLAEDVARFYYGAVAARAGTLVLRAVEDAIDGLRPYVEDPEQIRGLVRGFPGMPAGQRATVLEFLGVPEADRRNVTTVLSDPERALNVWIGETEEASYPSSRGIRMGPVRRRRSRARHHTEVSLEQLHTWTNDHVQGMEEFADAVRSGSLNPLNVQGALGEAVRDEVYRDMGFTTLRPDEFPHDNATTEFLPQALSATTFDFETLGELMFANHAARAEDIETIQFVGKITAMVVATVALVIVSGGIAGALSAAFGLGVAGEVVLGGLIFTLLSLPLNALSGQDITVESVLDDLVTNIAMFGAFRVFHAALSPAARSLVMGERAAAAGVAPTLGQAIRIGGIEVSAEFAAFLGVSFAQHVREHGQPPDGRALATMLYEVGLTVALLRIGGRMAGPRLRRMQRWGDQVRRGALDAPARQSLADVLRLEGRLQSLLRARPHRIAAEGQSLRAEYERVLGEQRRLLTEFERHWRTRGDAERMRQAGEDLAEVNRELQALQELGYLERLAIEPVGDSPSVFSYERSDQAADYFRRLYGRENVEIDADGTIRVRMEGAVERVFYPSDQVPAAEAVVAEQQTLGARRDAVVELADRLGIQHEHIEAIRDRARFRPDQRSRPDAIEEARVLVERAEQVAERQAQVLAERALRNFRRRSGGRTLLEEARTNELASMTDREVGEALHAFSYRSTLGGRSVAVGSLRGELSTAQVRGILFAARDGIDLARLRGRSSQFSAQERGVVLEAYAQFAEGRVEGRQRMLEEMIQQNSKFDGGRYVMDLILNEIGLERVRGVEVDGTGRRYDIVLNDGRHVEVKNWRGWFGRSLGRQFVNDLIASTDNFSNPEGIRAIEIIFRPPAPMEIGAIRRFLRRQMLNAMRRAGRSHPSLMWQMNNAFDAHANLVREGNITRSGRHRPEIAEPAPPPPIAAPDDDRPPAVVPAPPP